MTKQNENSANHVDRRSILRAAGSGSAAALGLGTVSSSAFAKQVDDVPFKITRTELADPDAVRADLDDLATQTGPNRLSDAMEDVADLDGNNQFALGVDLRAEDDAIDDRRPRLVSKIMGSNQTGRIERDHAGVLFAFTFDDGGRRVASQGVGVSIEPVTDLPSWGTEVPDEPTTHSGRGTEDNRTASAAGSGPNSVPVVARQFGEQNNRTVTSAANHDSIAVPENQDNVTTQGCWVSEGTCQDVLAVACAGLTQLDNTACLRACWRVGVANPIAGGACWGLCQAIITWYGAAACATQTDTVCDAVIDDNC